MRTKWDAKSPKNIYFDGDIPHRFCWYVYAQIFCQKTSRYFILFFRIVTWLFRAMTNSSNNGYLTFFFHTKTPKFWSIDLLWAASIISKIDEPKYCFVMVNFKNVVETLWDKGQSISEWIYEVNVSPKILTKNRQDFWPQYTGQKSWQFFVRILGETMTS